MPHITTELNQGVLKIRMPERIDVSNADAIHREMERAIEEGSPSSVVMDAGALTYISSVGLRELLGIKKRCGDVTVLNVSRNVYDIFETTGFTEIMSVERAFSEISINGCRVLGKGACGTVYKLDEERIVKVFVDGYDLEKVLKERNNAKNAFTHGIDTAIPFDIVKVGNRYGLIYEIIEAKTLKEWMTEDRDSIVHYIEIYARYIRHMHSIAFESGSYPDMKTVWKEKINALDGIFTDEEKTEVKKLIQNLPDRSTFVHGDINFGNLMVDHGKTVMIDMEDVTLGHPIYDVAFLYYILKLLPGMIPEDVYGAMIGFTGKEAEIIWNSFAQTYFDVVEEDGRNSFEKQIHPYGIIRLLDGVPSCFLVFDTYEEKRKEEIVSMYQPIAEGFKKELMDAAKNGIESLDF